MNPILRGPAIAPERRVLVARRAPEAHGATVPVNDAPSDPIGQVALEGIGQSTQENPDLDNAVGHEPLAATGYQQGHDQGYRAGFEAGQQSGEIEGRAAYTAGLEQLEQLTQSLNGSIQKSLDESEDMMVAIVYEAVCKIVGEALATREGVSGVVQEALSRVRGKSAVIVRVNPIDLELIEESAAFGIASETDWRADDSIPMGGCLIESEYGTLDARIDTQLNQLKRVLLAARHKPADQADAKRDD